MLFQSSDPERQGVRLRVTAASRAAAAASAGNRGGQAEQAQALHEEVLDRTAFQERASLLAAIKGGSPGGGDDGAAAPVAASTSSRLRQHYSALKPFVIISLSYLLFTITDGAGERRQGPTCTGKHLLACWASCHASAVACPPSVAAFWSRRAAGMLACNSHAPVPPLPAPCSAHGGAAACVPKGVHGDGGGHHVLLLRGGWVVGGRLLIVWRNHMPIPCSGRGWQSAGLAILSHCLPDECGR